MMGSEQPHEQTEIIYRETVRHQQQTNELLRDQIGGMWVMSILHALAFLSKVVVYLQQLHQDTSRCRSILILSSPGDLLFQAPRTTSWGLFGTRSPVGAANGAIDVDVSWKQESAFPKLQ